MSWRMIRRRFDKKRSRNLEVEYLLREGIVREIHQFIFLILHARFLIQTLRLWLISLPLIYCK